MASTYGSPSQLAGWAYGCAWYVLCGSVAEHSWIVTAQHFSAHKVVLRKKLFHIPDNFTGGGSVLSIQ